MCPYIQAAPTGLKGLLLITYYLLFTGHPAGGPLLLLIQRTRGLTQTIF
jgi:hypothetical protein